MGKRGQTAATIASAALVAGWLGGALLSKPKQPHNLNS